MCVLVVVLTYCDGKFHTYTELVRIVYGTSLYLSPNFSKYQFITYDFNLSSVFLTIRVNVFLYHLLNMIHDISDVSELIRRIVCSRKKIKVLHICCGPNVAQGSPRESTCGQVSRYSHSAATERAWGALEWHEVGGGVAREVFFQK